MCFNNRELTHKEVVLIFICLFGVLLSNIPKTKVNSTQIILIILVVISQSPRTNEFRIRILNHLNNK